MFDTSRMENSIELSRGATSWNARYLGPHSQQIYSLFETDILPTPFTPSANAQTVLAEITRLNPAVRVVLA